MISVMHKAVWRQWTAAGCWWLRPWKGVGSKPVFRISPLAAPSKTTPLQSPCQVVFLWEMKRAFVWKFERFCCWCCFCYDLWKVVITWDENGCCTWQRWKCLCAVSEGCPCSPGLIPLREWMSAGNWQASLCIRKLIASAVQSAVSIKEQQRRQVEKRTASFLWRRRLEIGFRLLQARTLFSQLSVWLAPSPIHSRQVDNRHIPSISITCLQSIQCGKHD